MEEVLLFKSDDKTFLWRGENWSYSKALEDQNWNVSQMIADQDDFPIFLAGEHSPVFSLGRSLHSLIGDSEIHSIPLIKTERGGKAMYHGPGQLTIYPIFRLQNYFSGMKDYVCFLFTNLKEYFLREHSVNLLVYNNGLWTQDNFGNPYKKVGFIGLRLKNGIVFHGFSLNYNCDLKPFQVMSPCDIHGDQVGNFLSGLLLDTKIEAQKIVEFLFNKLHSHSHIIETDITGKHSCPLQNP